MKKTQEPIFSDKCSYEGFEPNPGVDMFCGIVFYGGFGLIAIAQILGIICTVLK